MKAAVIKELIKSLADSAYEVEKVCLKQGWSAREIAMMTEKEDAVYLTAVRDSFVIGIAGMYIVAGEGQIMNIAVLPEYRRAGIGGMLLRALIEEGKKRGAVSFMLEVDSENTSAKRLYESLGFRETGSRKGLRDGDSALIMVLKA